MSEALAGPVFLRKFLLEKTCESHQGHRHNYDHAMIVVRGRVKVLYRYERDGEVVEGETREFGQGEYLVVKAEVYHTVKALEPNTIYFCVFSHRDFDGMVTQEYVGNTSANQ